MDMHAGKTPRHIEQVNKYMLENYITIHIHLRREGTWQNCNENSRWILRNCLVVFGKGRKAGHSVCLAKDKNSVGHKFQVDKHISEGEKHTHAHSRIWKFSTWEKSRFRSVRSRMKTVISGPVEPHGTRFFSPFGPDVCILFLRRLPSRSPDHFLGSFLSSPASAAADSFLRPFLHTSTPLRAGELTPVACIYSPDDTVSVWALQSRGCPHLGCQPWFLFWLCCYPEPLHQVCFQLVILTCPFSNNTPALPTVDHISVTTAYSSHQAHASEPSSAPFLSCPRLISQCISSTDALCFDLCPHQITSHSPCFCFRCPRP